MAGVLGGDYKDRIQPAPEDHTLPLLIAGLVFVNVDQLITYIVFAALCIAGIWGLGLATSSCNLHKVPLGADVNSWVLRHDGTLYHNGQEIGRLEDLPLEGDIIVS